MSNSSNRYEHNTEKRALVLSGGGSRGGYEIGVWQAMRQLGMDIHIVTGTSVGAINAAMICVGEFELAKNLWKDVETNMVFDLDNESRYDEAKEEIIKNTRGFMGMPVAEALSYAKYTVTKGGAGSTGLLDIMNSNLDVDAFYDSPVDYGMVVAELPSFKGHYLYKNDIPRDKISEYLVASASCFPAARYMMVDGMKLVDGGYADNLPIDMAMAMGAKKMVAVNMEAIGVVKKDSIERAKNELEEFVYITSKWDLGNFLCFDPETNRRNMTIGYLDAMKAFGKLDGSWYTFKKGTIPSQRLRRADAAARSFELDPFAVYTKEELDSAIRKKIPAVRRLISLRQLKYAGPMRNNLPSYVLAVIIADDFKEKGGASAFLDKRLISRLNKEILAASYLNSESLI